MSNLFFERPILNSRYGYPSRHWELDESGQPTQQITENRRRAEFITPIPKRENKRAKPSKHLAFDVVTNCDHIERKGDQLITNRDEFTGRRIFKVIICDLKDSHWVTEAFFRSHSGIIWSINQQMYANRRHHV